MIELWWNDYFAAFVDVSCLIIQHHCCKSLTEASRVLELRFDNEFACLINIAIFRIGVLLYPTALVHQ